VRVCGNAALVEVARRLPRHGPPNRNGYATVEVGVGNPDASRSSDTDLRISLVPTTGPEPACRMPLDAADP